MRKVVSMARRVFGTHGLLESISRIEERLLKFKLPEDAHPAVGMDAEVLQSSVQKVREFVAQSYIRGSGIEIGAFASPLVVPSGAKVTYVDKSYVNDVTKPFSISGLTLEDFGVEIGSIIEPDIVDDGETLKKVGDYSQDFVIANHVLEHFEDPIKGFKNMLRVLRHGGVLYLSLPEMRRSFDRMREPTDFEHIWRDYEEGPSWSRAQAYMEFSKIFVSSGMDKGLFEKLSGSSRDDFEMRQAHELELADFSIHFHAWTMDLMQEMFLKIKARLKLSFETKLVLQNEDEVIFVFQKTVSPVPI